MEDRKNTFFSRLIPEFSDNDLSASTSLQPAVTQGSKFPSNFSIPFLLWVATGHIKDPVKHKMERFAKIVNSF